ncbi:MAG TPA: hypothetical protein VKR60_07045 [Candidatus Sulfotelmatobacter sp.]|nr:hypothetical protein [Candidatus Sulfotelmatobacter sp.]
MSVSADRTMGRSMSVGGPLAASSYVLWVPLMGGLWVLTNVGFVYLGLHVAYSLPCCLFAGILNGTLFSVIAVAKASERFQAGVTGLLSGMSLSGLRKDGSMMWKATESVHAFVDQALRALGIEGGEQFHQQIEQQALYIIWTTLFVVVASLIAEWVRTSRAAES